MHPTDLSALHEFSSELIDHLYKREHWLVLLLRPQLTFENWQGIPITPLERLPIHIALPQEL